MGEGYMEGQAVPGSGAQPWEILGGLRVSLRFTEEPNQKNTKGASWLEEVPGRKSHQRNGMNLLSEAKDIG